MDYVNSQGHNMNVLMTYTGTQITGWQTFPLESSAPNSIIVDIPTSDGELQSTTIEQFVLSHEVIAGEVTTKSPAVLAAEESTRRSNYTLELQSAAYVELDMMMLPYGYSSVTEVITYADEPSVVLYRQQGLAVRHWRSQCRQIILQLTADWLDYTNTDELDLDAIMAALPTLTMPE